MFAECGRASPNAAHRGRRRHERVLRLFLYEPQHGSELVQPPLGRIHHIANALVRDEQRLPERLHVRANRRRYVVDVVRNVRGVFRDRVDAALDVIQHRLELGGGLSEFHDRRNEDDHEHEKHDHGRRADDLVERRVPCRPRSHWPDDRRVGCSRHSLQQQAAHLSDQGHPSAKFGEIKGLASRAMLPRLVSVNKCNGGAMIVQLEASRHVVKRIP